MALSRNQARYHERLLEVEQAHLWQRYSRLNQLARPDGLVLAGDSLAEYCPLDELLDLPLPIYNRGVHGITSQDLLDHLEEQVLGLSPRYVLLWIGINDLRVQDPEEALKKLEGLVCQIQSALPQAQFFVQSILPVNFDKFPRSATGRNSQTIQQLNDGLAKLPVQLLPVPQTLYDREGKLRQDLSLDGLHLNVEGYLPILDSWQETFSAIIQG